MRSNAGHGQKRCLKAHRRADRAPPAGGEPLRKRVKWPAIRLSFTTANLNGPHRALVLAAPHLVEAVELPDIGTEQMYDDVARVDQHPIRLIGALDTDFSDTRVFQIFDQMTGHRRDMPLRSAGCDHDVVADGGLPGHINGHDVFGLVVIQ